MNKFLKNLAVTITVFTTAAFSYADSSVETLSPELRGLLGKEMRSLQEGMQAILPAYVSGDLNQVVDISHKIKNSYILKQSISKDQKQELMHKLPASFLKGDQKFHKYAGMLEHVAKEGHMELVGFYYAKLIDSCVACHSEYAVHRFPKLQEKNHLNQNHHK